MRKRDERSDPNSCFSRARDDEMTFVLLGRDAAAPATIRFWISERVRLGKNGVYDDQLVEAEKCAQTMELERVPKDDQAQVRADLEAALAYIMDDETLRQTVTREQVLEWVRRHAQSKTEE